MLKGDIVIEMPKETDSLNTEGNSSKMIVLQPRPHVEEVVISDEEQTEGDRETYEEKLNKKLKDLDLFEEGMTVQQKEELLAVVVASWETAKEETTRRQFYQEYMTASEAFCNNDQIEFTFQDSPDLTNDASLLQATIQQLDTHMSEDSTNDPVPSGSRQNKGEEFGIISEVVGNTTLVSPLVEDEVKKDCVETYPEVHVQPYNSRSRGRPPRRGRPRKSRGGLMKQTTSSASSFSSESEISSSKAKETKDKSEKESTSSRLFDELVQPNPQSLDESLSSWKPCLSPKETPLFSSKRPWLNEENTAYNDPVEECTNLINSFSFAQREYQKFHPPDKTLLKPYHLARRGHFTKKSTRPDKNDTMIGVPSKLTTVQTLPENDTSVKPIAKDLLSRTTGTALQSAITTPANQSRTLSQYEAQTTRSGIKYGFYNQPQADKHNTDTDLTIKEPNSDAMSIQWLPGSSQTSKSPSPLFSDVEVILDEKLPIFSDLKPVICGGSFLELVSGESEHRNKCLDGCSSKTKCSSCVAGVDGMNHIANSASADNDSSEASSVIDVETIVDDEIEEFVSKRKLLHDLQSNSKEPSSTQRKRLKKGAS